MSNEVYYNEPGYEHLMGTPEGDRYNNAYSNIVRYGNLKYAIIEQMRNPTPGFEDVIRRNFFLKKEMILSEVDGWIERAKTEQADYKEGLTNCHNSQIANELGETPTSYREKMIELRDELLKEYAKLDSPFGAVSGEATKAPSLEKKPSTES